MRKLYNIAKGWFIFLFYKRSEMAQDRLDICKTCSLRKWYFCGECGCELHAKASLKEELCPKDKWPDSNNYYDSGNHKRALWYVTKTHGIDTCGIKTPGNYQQPGV